MAPILKVNVKLPKPQTLRQRLDRDCGVPVFGKLVGVTYEEVLSELPSAHLGITVDEWVRWLENKGLNPLKRMGCLTDILPCAHLVAMIDHRDYCHWVYRDIDGDVLIQLRGSQ